MLFIYITLFHKIIYTRANDASKISIAFLTVAMSISASFPVFEETVTQLFFSSTFGTKSFPFSSEENNPILEEKERETHKCHFLKTLISLYLNQIFSPGLVSRIS